MGVKMHQAVSLDLTKQVVHLPLKAESPAGAPATDYTLSMEWLG